MLPLPTQYLHNGFQVSKWFHRHYLILEAMWCSRKKIRLESGNLNCSLVSSTRCWWPWMRYLTCLSRSLLICNMPVLEEIISRSFQFQNSIFYNIAWEREREPIMCVCVCTLNRTLSYKTLLCLHWKHFLLLPWRNNANARNSQVVKQPLWDSASTKIGLQNLMPIWNVSINL